MISSLSKANTISTWKSVRFSDLVTSILSRLMPDNPCIYNYKEGKITGLFAFNFDAWIILSLRNIEMESTHKKLQVVTILLRISQKRNVVMPDGGNLPKKYVQTIFCQLFICTLNWHDTLVQIRFLVKYYLANRKEAALLIRKS